MTLAWSGEAGQGTQRARLAHRPAIHRVHPGRRREQRVRPVALVEPRRECMHLPLRLLCAAHQSSMPICALPESCAVHCRAY